MLGGAVAHERERLDRGVEVFSDALWAMDPGDAARETFAATERVLASAAAHTR